MSNAGLPPRGLLGIAGWSGSGKTTLLESLLPLLRARGLTVSTMKHTHHSVDLDQPGKDSYRHRAAGAEEVMVVSDARWALLRETGEPADLHALAARMAPVDLILVEGFKNTDFPRMEVYRPALGKPPLWPDAPGIVAVVTDTDLIDCPAAVLRLDEPGATAAWISAWVGGGLERGPPGEEV